MGHHGFTHQELRDIFNLEPEPCGAARRSTRRQTTAEQAQPGRPPEQLRGPLRASPHTRIVSLMLRVTVGPHNRWRGVRGRCSAWGRLCTPSGPGAERPTGQQTATPGRSLVSPWPSPGSGSGSPGTPSRRCVGRSAATRGRRFSALVPGASRTWLLRRSRRKHWRR